MAAFRAIFAQTCLQIREHYGERIILTNQQTRLVDHRLRSQRFSPKRANIYICAKTTANVSVTELQSTPLQRDPEKLRTKTPTLTQNTGARRNRARYTVLFLFSFFFSCMCFALFFFLRLLRRVAVTFVPRAFFFLLDSLFPAHRLSCMPASFNFLP